MIDLANLNEAIVELRDAVAAGKDSAVALRTIAEDYDLNPALLARKFEEKYQQSHTTYVAPAVTASTPDEAVGLGAWAVQRAKTEAASSTYERARRIAQLNQNWLGLTSAMVGTVFTHDGVQYVYAGLEAANRKYPILAVRVEDRSHRKCTPSFAASIVKAASI